MKKNKRKPTPSKARKPAQPSNEPQTSDRRDVLKLLRNGAVGTAALGGVGWWAVTGIRATAAEMDLSRIGSGKPTIVQIHDPQCAMCTELQRETRAALSCFGECDIQYLVASIRTEDGAQFAASLGLPHVTLVLMDGTGGVQEVLQGVRSREQLKPYFESLASHA